MSTPNPSAVNDQVSGCQCAGLPAFEEVLLRLKQQLKVSKDQEVAALLGMSKVAFSNRKTRGSFPENELYALAAKRPDLNLDMAYVLTGTAASAQAASFFERLARPTPAEAAAPLGLQIDIGRAIEQAFAEHMNHYIKAWLAARSPAEHRECLATVEQLLSQRRLLLDWHASLQTALAQPAQPASAA